MTIALIVAIVFVAALLQSLAGFGFAVMIMPLLTIALGLQTAAPMVALTALTVYSINLLRFRRAINIREVLRLAAASALGVPVGIWVLSNANEDFVKQIMGALLVAYAIYTLARPAASWVPSRLWVYPAGFAAGCLGGAYNTPGPPAIIYGQLRQWPRDEFRAAMQALFFVNGILVVSSHCLTGHVTINIVKLYLWAVPALALGILVSTRVDEKVNREHFRMLVTIMILVLGVSLLLGL